MEGQTENLKKPADADNPSPSSVLEGAMPLGKPDNFGDSNNPDNSFEHINGSLSSEESLKEGEGNGELPILQSEQPGLPKPQDLEDHLFSPESDPKPDSDYPKINPKKGIIPMILGFLEFLLRIFGFKKDKFPKI